MLRNAVNVLYKLNGHADKPTHFYKVLEHGNYAGYSYAIFPTVGMIE